jgi:hypothetical protein
MRKVKAPKCQIRSRKPERYSEAVRRLFSELMQLWRPPAEKGK